MLEVVVLDVEIESCRAGILTVDSRVVKRVRDIVIGLWWYMLILLRACFVVGVYM